MALAEALQATLEVVRVLEGLSIPYLLGGSLASSLHGIPRTTEDADLVAALEYRHVPLLVEALQGTFYIDADRMRDAIRRRASFNLVHLSTLIKVDIFVYKGDPFSRSEMERRQQIELPGREGSSLLVASAEDTILQKLRWYIIGGGVSERQWNDILGVLKVCRASLDLPTSGAGRLSWRGYQRKARRCPLSRPRAPPRFPDREMLKTAAIASLSARPARFISSQHHT